MDSGLENSYFLLERAFLPPDAHHSITVNKLTEFRDNYIKLISKLISNQGDSQSVEQAMSNAVGGSFESIGYLEKKLLQQQGLKPNHTLVDVGCGSGRLLSQLREDDINGYLGTDISQELLDYSAQFLHNSNWRLEKVEGYSIPASDNFADMVCMFSVITHLMPQHTYLYFREASRVLRTGGKLVVSFLEFRHKELWPIFEGSINMLEQEGQLDMFVDRDGLRLWGEKAGLEVVKFYDGEKPHITIDREIVFDNGLKVDKLARLGPVGQSVVIFKKA